MRFREGSREVGGEGGGGAEGEMDSLRCEVRREHARALADGEQGIARDGRVGWEDAARQTGDHGAREEEVLYIYGRWEVSHTGSRTMAGRVERVLREGCVE